MVEIHVRNLGPIKEGNISLKPLTIFVGPNNSGKTYLAYLIYGLIKTNQLRRILSRRRKMLVEIQEEMIGKGLGRGQLELSFDILEVLEKNSHYFRDVIKQMEEQKIVPKRFISDFWKFLGSPKQEYFVDFEAYITPKSINLESINQDFLKDISFQYFRVVPIRQRLIISRISKRRGSRTLTITLRFGSLEIYTSKKGHLDFPKLIHDINFVVNRLLLESIFKLIFPPLLNTPYVFPAQRNTLILDPIYSAINIATREEIIIDNNEIITTSVPEKLIKSRPIIDFLNMIDFASNVPPESPLFKIGKKLENVLGGEIVLTREAGRRSIYFVTKEGKKLTLQISSSMVQQLSSLVVYLKHLARPGDIIVIDEPESNLHPEAQIKVAEIIAEMVNKGIWVIVTTHSP